MIPAGCPRVEEDWAYNGLTYGRWIFTHTGGTAPDQSATDNQSGVQSLSLGIAAANFATRSRGIAQVIIPSGVFWQFNVGLSLPALSTPADRFIIRTGIGSNAANVDQTSGVYFEYSDNLSAGQWRICTANAGVRTKTISGRFAAVGKVSLKAFGFTDTQAIFNINGNVVGVNNTDFPTGVALGFFVGLYNVTATAVHRLDQDYFAWYYNIPAR